MSYSSATSTWRGFKTCERPPSMLRPPPNPTFGTLTLSGSPRGLILSSLSPQLPHTNRMREKAQLVQLMCTFLVKKIEFHRHHPQFEGTYSLQTHHAQKRQRSEQYAVDQAGSFQYASLRVHPITLHFFFGPDSGG